MVNRNVNFRITVIPGSKAILTNNHFKVYTTLHVNQKVFNKYQKEFKDVMYNGRIYHWFQKNDRNGMIRYYITIQEVIQNISSLDELQYKLHDLRKYSLELNNRLKNG